MALNRRVSLRNGPGGFQSLWACRGALLCVAPRKSVVWNLWTRKARERGAGVLCGARGSACLWNMRVMVRDAGFTGQRTLYQAVATSMGVV